MIPPPGIRLLHYLARFHGVQTAYYDVAHRRHYAPPEALLALLQALGVPVSSLKEVPSALRESLLARWNSPLEPVAIAWDGGAVELGLRLPAELAGGAIKGHLRLEDGEARTIAWRGSDLTTLQTAEVGGVRYVMKTLPLPGLPWGYHHLALEWQGGTGETLIISAPLRAYAHQQRVWGVFAPMYALRSERSWGCGDLSDMGNLLDWVASQGGSLVATLPFLARFMSDNVDPSPYSPISRLFWNEVYIDVTGAPELPFCPEAQSLISSASFQQELAALRRSDLVDYPQVMSLKRRALEALARCFFARQQDHLTAFRQCLETTPWFEKYAQFRAASERRRARLSAGSDISISGAIARGDYDEDTVRYYLYCQWLLHEQLRELAQRARGNGGGLYLDFPLGVDAQGFDVWQWSDIFVREVSVGAPPDIVFTAGQNWVFPPVHPERARQQGYRYFRACVNRHLQYAHMLRIDHIIGFHRLFWIPRGMEASQGMYVNYPAEELYAILALESQRAQSLVVGEDLGTVPPEVRPAMRRHGLYRSYVLQYELTGDPKAVGRIPAQAAASINTHDMPPFASFWQGLDIPERLSFGLLDGAGAEAERAGREAIRAALLRLVKKRRWLKAPSGELRDILKACLCYLSASPAAMVIANLEDLWLETGPQNIPSTERRRPNWRRKMRYSLEDISAMLGVKEILSAVDRLRKRG